MAVSAVSEDQSEFELVVLKSGERSIRSRRHGETMHIGTGPRTEALALHIGQQRLVERVRDWGGNRGAGEAGPFVIWDVGLGPAGNALTAIDVLSKPEAQTPGRRVEIHSFEISTDVLEFALQHAGELDYLRGWESAVSALLAEGVAFPTPAIRWQLHRGDFAKEIAAAPAPCAIFYDPYSPLKNPEMWSVEVFEKMRARASGPVGEGTPPCLLTNYTRSTAVRVTLALAGWFVGVGIPTGEKDQTTIAANRLELLERPLDEAWLQRVRRSVNAAPFRGNPGEGAVRLPSPISSEDLAALEALPQFAFCRS